MNEYQDFHYAISLAQTLYDIEFDDVEKAEEIGLVAYSHIGNHHTRVYKALVDVDEEGRAEMPCNLLQIESVTVPCHEDWESTSGTHEHGDLNSRAVEDFIEARRLRNDPLYQSGSFVKYRQEGNAIRLVPPFPKKVSVLYHGEQLSDDGLPYLNDKEAIAIAEYIGYVTKYKEAIRTNNQNALALANDLQQKWLFHCDAARVPVFLSQNDLDKALDAQTSWNRKKYHFSYKPLM